MKQILSLLCILVLMTSCSTKLYKNNSRNKVDIIQLEKWANKEDLDKLSSNQEIAFTESINIHRVHIIEIYDVKIDKLTIIYENNSIIPLERQIIDAKTNSIEKVDY